MKKILSVLLSITMIICMMPIMTGAAFADTATDITQDNCVFTPDKNSFEYDGYGHAPNVTYQAKNDAVLPQINGWIYTTSISYDAGNVVASPTNAGTYYIWAKYENDGEKYCSAGSFEITQLDISSGLTLSHNTFSDSETEQSLIEKSSFQKNGKTINIANDICATLTDTTVKYTGKNSNVTGEYEVSGVTVKTSIAKCTVTLAGKDAYSVNYNGKEQKPNVILKNGSTAVKDSEYTVKYENNINAGNTAKVIISAKSDGNYAGTNEVSFTINSIPAVLSGINQNVEITIPDQVHTGYSITPDPIVKDKLSGATLAKGTDYEISVYENNTDKGKATIKVEFKKNFSGQGSANFNIVDANNISLATVKIGGSTSEKITYDGNEKAVSVILNEKTLTNKDYTYTVSYKASSSGTAKTVTTIKDAGIYEITLTGKGSYTGTKTYKFTIESNSVTGEFSKDGYYFYTLANSSSARKYSYAQASGKKSSGYAVPDVCDKSGKEVSDVTFAYWTGNTFSTSSTYVSSTYLKKDGLYKVTFKANSKTYTTWYATGGQYSLKDYTLKLSSNSTPSTYKSGNTVTAPTVSSLQIGSYSVTKLTKDVDYKVTIKTPSGVTTTSSSWKDQGNYTFTATPNAANGAFTDSAVATFTLGVSTKLTSDDVVCSGLIPSYKVNDNGKVTISNPASGMNIYKGKSVLSGTKLTQGTDYRLTIVDETNTTKAHTGTAYQIGTYYIRVDFQGAYEGTVYFPFTVKGVANSITLMEEDEYTKYVTSDDFNLTATCLSGSSCTFTSSNPEVAIVNNQGTVSMTGSVGYTIITITSPNSGKYETEQVKIIVNAKPKKQVIKKVTSPAKGQLKVQVKKQAGVEKYQIRYSYTNKTASSNYGTVYLNDIAKYTSTQSKTVKKSKYLKSGKYAYVKTRAVYTKADGTKGYGAWSTVKKIKIK